MGLGLLVLEHGVQLELVGGAGAEVPQRVLGLPDHEVPDGGPGLGEWDQLELEARVFADIGRVPGHQGLLPSPRGDGQVGRRVGRRGDARRPREPVRDRVVGVVEVEVVFRPRQPVSKLDRVLYLGRREGCVGDRIAVGWPAIKILIYIAPTATIVQNCLF